MPQTRISQDVWDLGEKVARARGLGSSRAAIEAIVRVYADAYMAGSPVPQSQPQPQPPIQSPTDKLSAQDALRNLISEI